jgi:hypothetical protein
VQFLGLVGALLLGALVGFFLADRVHWALLFALFVLSPPGFYTIQASVDALGAVVVVFAFLQPSNGRLRVVVVLAFLVHLVAGLCLVPALAGRKLGGLVSGYVVLGLGVCAQIALGHTQVRYCLPGLSLLFIEYGRGLVGAPVYVQRLRASFSGISRSAVPVRQRRGWSLTDGD